MKNRNICSAGYPEVPREFAIGIIAISITELILHYHFSLVDRVTQFGDICSAALRISKL
jgi:hypothetical protein